jgi:tRNA(Ile)-lysidine synthase TilS/MesJ
MHEVIRCSRCILPSSLTGLILDENGVCDHCRKYENDFKSWDYIKVHKAKEFETILEKAKKFNRPYDVLVPLSGGKDSTYVLYLCTKIYGLKTLAVTLDNGFLTQPAKDNIRNAIASSNTDHIFYTINRENSSELFKTFIVKTGDFCNACMRGINYSIEFAAKSFKIPLVIKGSGRRVQYVSQIKEISSLNTASYFANVIRGTETEKKFNYLSSNKYKLEFQKIAGGICDILGITRTSLMRFIPQHIGMYDYIYLPFNEIIDILKKEMKWNDASGSIEHLDCHLHDVPFFKDTIRIQNITKNTFHRSGLIRQGLMSREEALKMEEAELQKKDPPTELLKFLDENKMSYEEYKNAVLNSNKSHYEPKFQKLAREVYHRFRKY